MGKPTSDNCYFEDVGLAGARNGDIARDLPALRLWINNCHEEVFFP